MCVYLKELKEMFSVREQGQTLGILLSSHYMPRDGALSDNPRVWRTQTSNT
jgi:hypothetical protein